MTLAEGLRAFLLDDAAIAAVVVARVYPGRLPQKAFSGPNDGAALVLTNISERSPQHLRGTGGLSTTLYQVDAWARTFDAATALGRLCRARLDGYTGIWSDSGSPAVDLRVTVLFDESRDLVEADIQGGLYRQSTDYKISWQPVS